MVFTESDNNTDGPNGKLGVYVVLWVLKGGGGGGKKLGQICPEAVAELAPKRGDEVGRRHWIGPNTENSMMEKGAQDPDSQLQSLKGAGTPVAESLSPPPSVTNFGSSFPISSPGLSRE